jgi:hypothetical protein
MSNWSSGIDEHQVIWLGAEAITFEAPCERCREDHGWAAVIDVSVVTGTLRPEADVGFTACKRGHRIRVRRISRLRAVASA